MSPRNMSKHIQGISMRKDTQNHWPPGKSNSNHSEPHPLVFPAMPCRGACAPAGCTPVGMWHPQPYTSMCQASQQFQPQKKGKLMCTHRTCTWTFTASSISHNQDVAPTPSTRRGKRVGINKKEENMEAQPCRQTPKGIC